MISDALQNRLSSWEGVRFPMPTTFTSFHERMCLLSSVSGVHADGGFFAYIVHGAVWPDLDKDKWHFVDVTDGEILTFDTWQELATELTWEV